MHTGSQTHIGGVGFDWWAALGATDEREVNKRLGRRERHLETRVRLLEGRAELTDALPVAAQHSVLYVLQRVRLAPDDVLHRVEKLQQEKFNIFNRLACLSMVPGKSLGHTQA